jgi:hypothetical protein
VKTKLTLAAVLVGLASAGSAGAAEEEAVVKGQPRVEDSVAPGDDDDFGHGLQFGVRAGVVGGYRMVFRYDESPFCTRPDTAKALKDQQKFCGHGSPLAVDLGLSFAPFDFVEPFAWGRFGLAGEGETNTEPLMVIGVGARLYTMSDSKFKIFIEPALGFEFEGGAGNALWQYQGFEPEYKQDMVFHLAAGPQFDVARAFGFYVSGGLSVGVLRAIHSSLDLQGGVQVRVP